MIDQKRAVGAPDDVLRGLAAIAAALGLTKAEARALGKAGRLPLSRSSDGELYATRAALDAWKGEQGKP